MTRSAFVEPRELVAWLGAIQAQDYAGTKWAVGLRLARAGLGDEAVERAIATGSILRMHVMRWTWQLVLPEDARWMLALVKPRLVARAKRRHETLDLDDATFRKSNDVLEKALRDGRHRTRQELATLLAAARIPVTGERLSHLLGRAELDAILSSGARRGKQFTYVHMDERAPLQRTPLSREEAIAGLALRYFRSRGPALLDDFIWWSGLTASEARMGLEATRSSLVSEVIDGRTYFHGEAPKPARAPRSGCHLLPPFDEYIVAYRNRDALIDERHIKLVNAGGGMLNPVVIVAGRVRGTWRRELAPDHVTIEVDLFDPPTPTEEREIERAAERFGSFLGKEPRIVRRAARGRSGSSRRAVNPGGARRAPAPRSATRGNRK